MKYLYLLGLVASAGVLTACSSSEPTPEATTALEIKNEAEASQATTEVDPPVTEEILTEAETAAYQAEQVLAVEAQAKRLETLAATTMETLATGTFEGIAWGHDSEGSVTIKATGDQVMVELGEDFKADRGPDLYVILTQQQPLTGEDPLALDKNKIKILEPLASRRGQQVYTTTRADFDTHNYGVVIWCQKYNVVFGGAVLQ